MSFRHVQRLLRSSCMHATLRSAEHAQVPAGAAALAVLAQRLASSGACSSGSAAWQPASTTGGPPIAPSHAFGACGFASGALEADKRRSGGAAAALGGAAAAADGEPEQYTQIGRITSSYQVPRKLAFAVVEVGPTQFRVSQGDTIVTEKLKGVDINDKISLNRVLMLGSRHETIIGRPFIPQAVVTAAVEEQFRDGKVLIFKKRRRKHSRRLRGHRQELTTLRVLEVNGIEAEAPPVDRSPKWWQARKSAGPDAEAAATVVA